MGPVKETVEYCIRIFIAALILTFAPLATANVCPPDRGIAVQVLGSGGPVADDGRASSGYIVWSDGKSRVLIDAGGGTLLRFAEAGADFRDLEFIGLSHFHADHAADFPALLKSGNFSGRSREIIVAGPDGRGQFPGLSQFLSRLLDPETGAFAYLGGYLDGSAGLPKIAAFEIDSANIDAVRVLDDEAGELQIDALHVPHGIVPALAFRVRIGQSMVVFASDQNGDNDEFANFAKDADVLVMHMPVPEGVTGTGRRLHAPPSVLGEIADRADPELLVLSHFMERSLRDLEQNVNRVRSRFSGTISIADDLACYRISDQEQ